MRVCFLGDCVVFKFVSGHVCMVIVCVCVDVKRVSECVCAYYDVAAFVCVSCHVCMVIVRVCEGAYMFVNVCACIVVVLCLYVSLAMVV